METISIPKKDFDRIIEDMEILLSHVEVSLDKKAKKRLTDIKSGKEKGKNEEELDSYLKNRGVKF